MSYIFTFIAGVAIGSIYQKLLLSWKQKAERVARAASQALKEG